MANDMTGRVWVMDTVSTTVPQWAILHDNQSGYIGKPVYISRMEWHPDAAGDQLLVQDVAGKVIWKHKAKGAYPNDCPVWESPNPELPYLGFWLYTMTNAGGTAELHVSIG